MAGRKTYYTRVAVAAAAHIVYGLAARINDDKKTVFFLHIYYYPSTAAAAALGQQSLVIIITRHFVITALYRAPHLKNH